MSYLFGGSRFEGYDQGGRRSLNFGGGGSSGGGTTQSTGTTYQTNIPEYAKPYVESMLGATQQQLFNTQQSPSGDIMLTGFKPYTPYSQNPEDYIAPFSPLQKQAITGTANLQVPEQFGYATEMTGRGGLGALTTAREAGTAGERYAGQATNPYATRAYMSPYIESALTPQLAEMERQYMLTGQQERAKASAAGAFGGTRDALMQAENQRNKNIAMNQAIGQGYQNAFQAAQQAQQFGANLGLQGQQAALQGYGQAGTLGSQLGNIGQQQLAAQQGILGAQYQMGAQEQARQQQIINQAIQDYATAQQYPLMQLGFMSNMLRGLPMQSTSTQQYVATPSNYQQAVGAVGTGASLYNAMKAKGGIVDSKKMASGGIVGYDVGGRVESLLDEMSPDQLKEELQKSSSPTVKKMAARMLMEKKAGGGIVAFAQGSSDGETVGDEKPKDYSELPSMSQEDMAKIRTQEAPAAPAAPAPAPAAQTGILQAAAPQNESIAAAIDKSPMPDYLKVPIREQLKENTKSFGQIHKEQEDEFNKYVGPDVAGQEYRAKIMAERANAEDEANRQKWMRAAEFFAAWGSTPGPALSAGLQAMRKTIPNLISDKADQKKYMKELDKSIYDIDRATRLEKAGRFEDSTKIKEGQAKTVQGIVTSLTNIYEADERNKTARATAAGKSEDNWAKSVQRAELEFKNDPKTQAIMKEIKRREDNDEMTPKDRAYYESELDKIRNWHYDNNKIGRPSAPVERGMSPSERESRRSELEKKIDKNTHWYRKPNESEARAIKEAQEELDAMDKDKGAASPQKPAESAPSSGIPTVSSQKEYDKLQKGDKYRDPDGNIRTKG